MRPDGVRLSPLHRATLYGTFAVLAASGALWALLHDGLPFLGIALPAWHGAEPSLLALHGAAAMLMLLVLGSLVPQHVKWSWKGRLNRGTGGSMVATQVLLLVTGYALYYAGGEEARTVASDIHLAVGVGSPLLLLWHIVAGRRRRRPAHRTTRRHAKRPARDATAKLDAGATDHPVAPPLRDLANAAASAPGAAARPSRSPPPRPSA